MCFDEVSRRKRFSLTIMKRSIYHLVSRRITLSDNDRASFSSTFHIVSSQQVVSIHTVVCRSVRSVIAAMIGKLPF